MTVMSEKLNCMESFSLLDNSHPWGINEGSLHIMVPVLKSCCAS